MKDVLGVVGAVVAMIALFLGLMFGVNLLLTYGIIWVANGLFDTNLFPKFWYIFWGLYLVSMLFNPIKITRSK